MASDATAITYSHTGICVSDLDRSLRFYCDGLGFEKGDSFEVGGEYAASLELRGDGEAFVTDPDGVRVELMKAPATNRTGDGAGAS